MSQKEKRFPPLCGDGSPESSQFLQELDNPNKEVSNTFVISPVFLRKSGPGCGSQNLKARSWPLRKPSQATNPPGSTSCNSKNQTLKSGGSRSSPAASSEG